ncbi:undecaprenyl/decaprenyl-phosphate alpha-N-acetylglucosaminyl 1-phosphate transferase [Planosporangium thailandense]|uniref:Undecaprenyl/decaprenyl-phosphate alpha-N-acetylglucosaminyl 1-phosphate transferase n=1 Tax=Planosporangium thailandense TaxID=765197 RepID=A0ABX0YAM6_9ACTN|nr:MraY family glycosyltransferase [Planosporangium thailandense]NJC74289.1 undecaprenyl/decaprenyl-phosphate alpha-N-acetylglucosaminyl 1-phosphate transferase [Planosporangium thailandense]
MSIDAVAPVVTAGLTSLAVAAALTEPMRRVALRLNLTDRPAAHKAHLRATPYLGGVAVAVATFVPATFLLRHWDARLVTLALGGLLIAVLGLVDDVRSLHPLSRLGVETAVAALLAAAGTRIDIIGPAWTDAVVTVVWLVVMTNSFNLLDNSDGAAGSIAAATGVALAVYALVNGRPGVAVLLAGLAAGAGGFLSQNWPPARIFMGDTGSLFIGFMIGGSAVALVGSSGGTFQVGAALLLVTFVATVDTTLVVVSRVRAGRRWLDGGTDHIAHRLRRLGFSRPQVPATLAVLALASTALGLLAASGALPVPTVLITTLAAGAAAIWWLLRVPVYPQPASDVADGATLVAIVDPAVDLGPDGVLSPAQAPVA